MKKSLAIVSTVLAAVVSLAAPRKAADITVAGYTGSTTLANFPVLVRYFSGTDGTIRWLRGPEAGTMLILR